MPGAERKLAALHIAPLLVFLQSERVKTMVFTDAAKKLEELTSKLTDLRNGIHNNQGPKLDAVREQLTQLAEEVSERSQELADMLQDDDEEKPVKPATKKGK